MISVGTVIVAVTTFGTYVSKVGENVVIVSVIVITVECVGTI